ncbi:2748_t:CDS:2, partial [Racocetra persica]
MSKENKNAKKPKDINFSTKALHNLDKKSVQIEKCEKERKEFSNLILDKKSDQIKKCEKERKEFSNLISLPIDPLDQLQKIRERQHDSVLNPLKKSQAIVSNLSTGKTEKLIETRNNCRLIQKQETLQISQNKTPLLPLRPPSSKFSGLNYSSKSTSSVESSIKYFEKLASKVIPINEEKEKPMPLSTVQPKIERRKVFSLPNAPDVSSFFVNHDYSVAFLKKPSSYAKKSTIDKSNIECATEFEDKKILKTMNKSLSLSSLPKSETIQHSISSLSKSETVQRSISSLLKSETVQHSISSLPKSETVQHSISSLPKNETVQHSISSLPKNETVQHSISSLPKNET